MRTLYSSKKLSSAFGAQAPSVGASRVLPRLIPMPIFFCISAGVVGVDDDAEAHAKAERTSRLRMSKRGNAESYGTSCLYSKGDADRVAG